MGEQLFYPYEDKELLLEFYRADGKLKMVVIQCGIPSAANE